MGATCHATERLLALGDASQHIKHSLEKHCSREAAKEIASHKGRFEGYCQLDARSAQLPQVLPSSQSRSAYEGSPGRIAPRNESAIAGHAILTGGKTVTAELEVVVDRSVSGEELLCVPD